MIWKFKPVVKHTIWGGDRLGEIAPVSGIAPGETTGELWVLSDVPGSESRVAGGPDEGLTPGALTAKYGTRFLREGNVGKYDRQFPLLVKIIDAARDLSVQVHPDDAYARSKGEPYGKSEMWYVMSAAPDARLACGLCRPLALADFHRLAEDGGIERELRFFTVKPGEVFEIPARRIHALGRGCVVAEIQQSSNTTYRIYDYKRKDAEGHERQLHLADAEKVSDLEDVDCRPRQYDADGRDEMIADMPQFEVRLLTPGAELMERHLDGRSFRLFMPVSGRGVLKGADREMPLEVGECVVISADEPRCVLSGSEDFKLLESFVK